MKVKNIMFSGLMAVILMGVAGNASAEESSAIKIASKAYVDTELESKASTTELTNVQNTLQAAIDDKADQTYVGTIPSTATAQDIVGYIQEKTAGIATDTALEELTGRVATAEGEIDTLQGNITTLNGSAETAGSVAHTIADALEGYATETYVGTEIKKVTDVMATDDEVANAITALDLANKYEAKGAAATVQANVNTLSATVATNTENIGKNTTAISGLETNKQDKLAAGNYIAIGEDGKTVSVTADGAVATGNTGLVTGGTVYDYAIPKPSTECTEEGKNCVLSTIGGTIQWVDITMAN